MPAAANFTQGDWMKISKIDCHVLLVPNYDPSACSSAQDDLVIEVHTDEGLIGIGETDTNPWIGASVSGPVARIAWG